MIFGILSFLILNIYAATTLGAFFFKARKSTTITSIFQQFYSDEETFGTEQSLSIAVGLDGVASFYLQEENGLLIPEIGELRMSIHEEYANDTFVTIPIKTHPCTAEELGQVDLFEDEAEGLN